MHTDMQQRRELAHRYHILDKSMRLAMQPSPVTHTWGSRGQSCNIPCDHMFPIPSAAVTGTMRLPRH